MGMIKALFDSLGSRKGSAFSQSKLLPESDYILTVTETGVSCRRPDGTVESVQFADLRRIEIRTNGLGPWEPDVFIALECESGGCLYPMGATNEVQLLDELFRLPGFNLRKFTDAAAIHEPSVTLVWERERTLHSA